jgi:hypothetical protein
MKTLLYISIALIFTGGVFTQPENEPLKCKERPWMLNPNINGKLGAVGSAMQTYDQKTSTQRKLAITRALDELSLQQGVDVTLSMQKNELVENERATTKIDSASSYETKTSVSAHIQDACKDNYTGEFFVWMVMDN